MSPPHEHRKAVDEVRRNVVAAVHELAADDLDVPTFLRRAQKTSTRYLPEKSLGGAVGEIGGARGFFARSPCVVSGKGQIYAADRAPRLGNRF